MSTEPVFEESTYGRMLEQMRPRVIRTDDECERLTDELMRLDEMEKPSHAEAQMAELLTVLIEEYEQRRHPVPHAAPQRVLLHLMEARRVKQKDLRKIFGSKGITSEVIRGKRAISKAQAKRLADFFHVSAELFI